MLQVLSIAAESIRLTLIQILLQRRGIKVRLGDWAHSAGPPGAQPGPPRHAPRCRHGRDSTTHTNAGA